MVESLQDVIQVTDDWPKPRQLVYLWVAFGTNDPNESNLLKILTISKAAFEGCRLFPQAFGSSSSMRFLMKVPSGFSAAFLHACQIRLIREVRSLNDFFFCWKTCKRDFQIFMVSWLLVMHPSRSLPLNGEYTKILPMPTTTQFFLQFVPCHTVSRYVLSFKKLR
jgi:hypothetical protein